MSEARITAGPVAAAPLGGALLARWRVRLVYGWRHRRRLRLAHPRLFTEWVQWRKLADRDPRMPVLADKLRVKAVVADALGARWVTPTCWAGTRLPDEAPWPLPFVVKSRHGCRQVAIVRDLAEWPAVRARALRWLERGYGNWLDEWAYRDIPRGLLVEPFIGDATAAPHDYKFYVFGGRAAFIQVHVDREADHRWIVLDRDWQPAAGCAARWRPVRPLALAEMIAAAERLGAPFEFVRIDLYALADGPRFGEISFYPGSGLDAFDPPSLDAEMGALWRQAATGLSMR